MNRYDTYYVDWSIKVIAFILRPLAKITQPFCKNIMLGSPAGVGSLGDQAMLQPLQDLAVSRGANVKQLLIEGREPFNLEHTCCSPFYTRYVSRFDELRFMISMLKCDSLVILGADVFDGRYNIDFSLRYLKLANIAALLGKNVRYTGFSFSTKASEDVIKHTNASSNKIKFLIRDPDSFERFRDITSLDNSFLVADNAFNLSPRLLAKSAVECKEWIKSHQDNNLFIGVNANVLTTDDRAAMIKILAKELEVLCEDERLRFVFVPHDFREKQSDHDTLSEMLDLIPDVYKNRFYLLGKDINSWDVKAIAKNLDLVLTGRMHFAIAAMGGGTPAVTFSYADKFSGLYKHFELDASVLEMDPRIAYKKAGYVSQFVRRQIEDLNELTSSLQKRLPFVKDMARINLLDL